jgi:hypothetical protein
MTGEEWLTCTDLQQLLCCLRGRASERKRRLFDLACCRTIWRLLHKRARKAIALMEEFVDAMTTTRACERARDGLCQNRVYFYKPRKAPQAVCGAFGYAAQAVWNAVSTDSTKRIYLTACWKEVVNARLAENEEQDPAAIETDLSDLFHCIFDTLFHPVPFDPAWLSWSDRTCPKLAQVIYDERHFEDLPILADAIEEAGCTDPDILAHCRGPGPHVRGCWVVDLLLGKS